MIARDEEMSDSQDEGEGRRNESVGRKRPRLEDDEHTIITESIAGTKFHKNAVLFLGVLGYCINSLKLTVTLTFVYSHNYYCAVL